MKTVGIFVIITAVIVFISVLPQELRPLFVVPIPLGSAIWVYFDATRLQVQRYTPRWYTPSITPLGNALFVLVLWPIAFPAYLVFRNKMQSSETSR